MFCLSLHNYVVSFVYMFVVSHAVKSNYNRIQVLNLCVNCTMGAEILHDQVQTNDIWTLLDTSSYRRGGVSVT